MVRGSRSVAGMFVAAAVLVGAEPSLAADREGRTRVIAVDGVAQHRSDLRVEILVEVRAGASARAAGDRALEAQGAKRPPKPPQSAGFTLSGLRWDTGRVTQNYNPAGQPTTAARTALTNTYGDWSSVSGANFGISSGGTTTRCPSLVRECPGRQVFDGLNDVGWAQLSGSALGVTWYSTSIDEADMAINTRAPWSTGCTQVAGRYDLETVYLHENGHVAGLGHSSDPSAVMYPSYQTARCTLAQDDKNGLAALY
jgi:Matrixin